MSEQLILNKQQPLVSIIIPTFERLHYLPYAIESALAQTYQNTEVIVSDDGSTSDVRSLVAAFTDKRIRYRRNDVNIGQVLNNLSAFKEAKGKYVANLHDDDMWEPTFLEKLIPPMESDEDIVLAFSNHFIMNSAGEIDEQTTEQNEAFYKRDILTPGLHRPFCRIGLVDLSIPLAMASVYRKDVIDWDDFPTEVNSFYDRWLIYLACRTGMGAYFHTDRLTRYRVHAASATGKSGVDIPRSSLACHNRFLQDERLKPHWPALKKLRDLGYTRMGICQLEEGSVKEARRNLILSIKNKPNIRATAALCLSVLPVSTLKAIVSRYRDR